MQAAVEAAGFETLNLGYQSRKKPLERLITDIHAEIDGFARRIGGPIHFVTHSMGALLTRAYLARHPPARLGRVVMLGPPNGGSEIADLLKDFSLYRGYFGPAGQQLTTVRDAATRALLSSPRYAVGIVAGNRTIDPIAWHFLLPKPNDGRVSVHNTKLDGMADHIVIAASHAFLVRDALAIEQTLAFLRDGRFKT
jgi:pimeloyl-ACP methyl ester carboxylesterase